MPFYSDPGLMHQSLSCAIDTPLEHGFNFLLKTGDPQYPTLVHVVPNSLKSAIGNACADQSLIRLTAAPRGSPQRHVHLMILYHRIPLTQSMVPITAPDIGARLRHKTRSNRIEFQGPIAGEQGALTLNDGGLESAFPKRACASIGGVHIAYITPSHRLHQR